ncbi:hypothetical protein [Mucilaginibacter defluvii]|uniref:hypothetical protein n=1 Tax=Mucilaginibacter defluvii TaxID=1196019 RepID=UPI0031ED5413
MKVKAFFLLITFLLNTAVGLACALHMSHERSEHNRSIHSHLDHHTVANKKSQHGVIHISGKEDPCCQGAVSNFNAVAKIIPQALKLDVQLAAALLPLWGFTAVPPLYSTRIKQQCLLTTRQRPPTADLRVLIQSFQI